MYRMYKRKVEKATKQEFMRSDVNSYIGDNVRKIKHRMRKVKYGCAVID